MKRKLIVFCLATMSVLWGAVGMAFAVTDGKIEEPTTGGLANTVTLPSTAVDAATAVPVFDFQIVNPTSAGNLPIMIDNLTVTFAAGTATLADLGGMKVKVSGTSNPTFTNTDSILVTVGGDPITYNNVSGVLAFNGAAAADGLNDADLLSVANGDTVRVTVYAWLTGAAAVTDGQTLTADIAVAVAEDGGASSDAVTSETAVLTTITEQTAFTIASTAGTPGGLDTTLTVPSTATSKAVAVPVYQLVLTDLDDGAFRVSKIDGLTIPITLGGGMDPADIVGASLQITSSTPVNNTVFSATVGADREINTANDPTYIKLVTVGSNLELQAGTNAGLADVVGTADLLEIPDLATAPAPDQTVTLTVKIWLASSGITSNSTATFDLKAANVTVDLNAAASDVLNLNTDVANGVATIIVASSQNTTLSDRSEVPSTVSLPSTAVAVGTAYKVFDFFITDGIGGQSTKIDSLTIPVTLSGGAKFRDLKNGGVQLTVGGGITALAGVGGTSINSFNNSTLVKIDSVSATQARITFKGRVPINTADAIADLAEIPDGGGSGAFTVAVWVDSSSIAYGATLTFDLQNQHVTLTGQNSDGLAASQNVTDGVATIAVARIADLSVSSIPNPDTLSSAAIASTINGTNDADNAVEVFDFQIIDPPDGAPLLIDGLRIPLTFSGGADINDVVGAKLVVSGLSANTWVGPGTNTIFKGQAGSKVEIDVPASAIDVGALSAGGGTLNDATVDALNIPDGETATITVSLWLSQASLVDSSKVSLTLNRAGVILAHGGVGATTAMATNQLASGAGIIRVTRLVDNPAVPMATYLSNVNTGTNYVDVFGFMIIDPPDGKATKIDRIVLPATGTGVDADITDVKVTVSGATFVAGVGKPDVNSDGVMSILDAGANQYVDTGNFPANPSNIALGLGAANTDGVADLISIADGTTATFLVSVINGGAATPTNAVTLDLGSANVVIDGGITVGLPGSAIVTGLDLTNKVVTVTSATTLVTDLAPPTGVANAVSVSSLTNTAVGAVSVFDFTVTDAAAGFATNIDELTIPVTFSGVDFTDVAGVVVTTSQGNFVAASTAPAVAGNTLTSGVNAGIELQSTAGGMNILLGGATAAVVTAVSNGTPELLAVANPNPASITVKVYLSNTSGVLTDNATMTFSLGAADFETDTKDGVNPGDAIIPAQSITPGKAMITVTATKLEFTAPTVMTLATQGISDTIRVAATDANNNVDVEYATSISVATSSGTGQFKSSQIGSAFLSPGANLPATPTTGVLSFFYKDSATGTPTLTASSGSLTNGILVFTVQAFTATVTWTNPAVGSTTETDSAGTFHRLQYTVSSNDPNLLVEFWAAPSQTLSEINSNTAKPLNVFDPDSSEVLGRLRNPTGMDYGPGNHKLEATDVPISVTSQYVYTINLNDTTYIYMIRADGDSTSEGGKSADGDILGVSGALKVLYYPDIVAFGVAETQNGSVKDSTSFTRDSGGNTPDTSIDLLLYAEDHNSNDDVRLYISTNSSLTAATVTTDTTSTYQIAGTTSWKTDDVGDTLRYATVTISDSLGSSAYHPKGTYYFYALVTDADDSTKVAFAKAQNLSIQQQSLGVNHAPILTFSQPAAAVTGHSIADQPRLTLAWNGSGAAGDQDIDDNAYISLWFAVADSTPDAFVDTTKSWLKKIVSGLREDADGGANDQYAWDLTLFDGELPAAGTPIKVWALLQDDGATPVFAATPQITFATYDPSLVLLNPPPGAATEIRENEIYRFFFDADYVSDATTNGTVRFFISAKDTTSLAAAPAVFTFDTGASSTFPGNYNAFWISGQSQLKEGVDRYFDWTPKNDGNNYAAEIVPQTSTTTTFYLYAVINTNGNAITSPNTLKLARAPGRIKINGLGTTLADPATVASPNQAQVTAGDTIRVLLKGNTNNTAVQGAQLYVNIDSTQFALVDQDNATAGVQPFGFETSYFFGSVSAQINRVTLDSTTYKLDLDKRNLSVSEDPTGKTIAHVDLVARSFSGSAEVNWSLDRVNDPNRYPLFFNASGELAVLFFNPLATFNTVSRGSISGFVPLQGNGRTTDAKVTTFWLRRPGSWITISDTAFVNTNDDSSSVEGIQTTTGADGAFTLTKAPAGVYELVAKSESYLAGYASVSVVNGQTVTGLTPTRITADNDPGQLLGGDITGDNKIDTNDESALNLAYESSSGSSSFNSAADTDDDGSVLLSDLLILAANLQTPLLTGVDPVYKPVVNEGAVLTLAGVPLEVRGGEEFTVELALEGILSLAGYSLGLEFDQAVLAVMGADMPLLASHATVRIQREVHSGRYVLAEAVKGSGDVRIDQPLLATVRLRALTDAVNPTLAVAGARLADGSGQQVELPARVTRALPERFALRQNAPNPFNPSTHISFDVPQDGVPVELTIFNVMGQPIRRLVQAREMRAGRYRLSWDGYDDQGRPVGSGTYLYTLRAGDFAQTRKMTMMK